MRRNPGDDEIRWLERAAAQGDPAAAAAFAAARGRRGILVHGDVVTLEGVGFSGQPPREFLVLNMWDQTDLIRLTPVEPTPGELRRQRSAINRDHYVPHDGAMAAFDTGRQSVRYAYTPTTWLVRSSKPPVGARWADDSRTPRVAQFDDFQKAREWAEWLTRHTERLMGWTPLVWLTVRLPEKKVAHYELKGGDFVHGDCYREHTKEIDSPLRGRPIERIWGVWPMRGYDSSVGRARAAVCVVCGRRTGRSGMRPNPGGQPW